MVMLLVEGGEKIQWHRAWNKHALLEATSIHKLQLTLVTFKNYFSSPQGEVSWQYQHVRRTN